MLGALIAGQPRVVQQSKLHFFYMNKGYISIHRKLINWEWWEDHNTTRLFIFLICMANWKDKKWKGIIVKRGSFITSINKLSIGTGLTPMQIRTSIKKLLSTNEITNKTTNNYTVISISNYNLYQQNNKQDNKRITNEQQTDNKRITTTNKDNKDKKDKKREYLKKIPLSDIKDFVKKFPITRKQVIEKGEELFDYCEATGKKYRNYKALLRNAIRKDYKNTVIKIR